MYEKYGLHLDKPQQEILVDDERQYECNCRNKDECLLENKSLTSRVIYEADVITLRSFILGYLILHLKSVTITISVILETGVMRKVLSFETIFGACKKVV